MSSEHHKGIVVKVTRKVYDVSIAEQTIPCTVRGKVTLESSGYTAVKVGDQVDISLVNDAEGIIENIHPRKSQLSRSILSRAYNEHIIAANIDQLLIILAARNPRFTSGLLDRYLVIAEKNQLGAIICINKIDLAESAEFQPYQAYYTSIGYPVHLTSALSGEGVAGLSGILKNSLTAVVGHSGVGKSSIIHAIDPGLDLRIGDVSDYSNKGQHTTTSVELFRLSGGGYVIDTPGIRELGFWDIYKSDLPDYFKDISRYSGGCQFADCQHLAEPGCAVKAAVESGNIFRERYENYVGIYESLRAAHYEYAGRRVTYRKKRR